MRDVSRTRAGPKRRQNTVTSPSRLKELRDARQLSQEELAAMAGMHRNSIYKLEKGISREISAEHASALATALRVKPRDLGLTIRPQVVGTPRSVRFRQLTAEQRQLVDELLALPPEHYGKIRAALERLRSARKPKRRRSG